MSKHYSFACVREPLVNVHLSQHGRKSSDMAENINAWELVYSKHADYLLQNKNEYAVILEDILRAYTGQKMYKDAFRIWLRRIAVKPADIIRNIWLLLKLLAPKNFKDKVKELIKWKQYERSKIN